MHLLSNPEHIPSLIQLVSVPSVSTIPVFNGLVKLSRQIQCNECNSSPRSDLQQKTHIFSFSAALS